MSVMPFEFMETVILQLTNWRVGDGGGRWGVGDGGGRDWSDFIWGEGGGRWGLPLPPSCR